MDCIRTSSQFILGLYKIDKRPNDNKILDTKSSPLCQSKVRNNREV
jgi:hypothetical protein